MFIASESSFRKPSNFLIVFPNPQKKIFIKNGHGHKVRSGEELLYSGFSRTTFVEEVIFGFIVICIS